MKLVVICEIWYHVTRISDEEAKVTGECKEGDSVIADSSFCFKFSNLLQRYTDYLHISINHICGVNLWHQTTRISLTHSLTSARLGWTDWVSHSQSHSQSQSLTQSIKQSHSLSQSLNGLVSDCSHWLTHSVTESITDWVAHSVTKSITDSDWVTHSFTLTAVRFVHESWLSLPLILIVIVIRSLTDLLVTYYLVSHWVI